MLVDGSLERVRDIGHARPNHCIRAHIGQLVFSAPTGPSPCDAIVSNAVVRALGSIRAQGPFRSRVLRGLFPRIGPRIIRPHFARLTPSSPAIVGNDSALVCLRTGFIELAEILGCDRSDLTEAIGEFVSAEIHTGVSELIEQRLRLASARSSTRAAARRFVSGPRERPSGRAPSFSFGASAPTARRAIRCQRHDLSDSSINIFVVSLS
ncbi:hypothetical protein [Brevibacterium casei]|uniref:Uncharacterized protein n=1 Tax=Brevibacterium casei TaxID=33889 RepID=A0AB34XRZ9_9MICO|nr:hypothetical protein [Brevibacterium casei]KZE18141.1 hypothetical protein AVW13_01575 [Brevibacterium casei]